MSRKQSEDQMSPPRFSLVAVLFVAALSGSWANSAGSTTQTQAAAGATQVKSEVAPVKPGPLDKMSAYQGTWKITSEKFDTPFSKAGKESLEIRNDCQRKEQYFVCEQFMGGESKSLWILTFDPKSGSYSSYGVPPDGGEVHSGKLLVEANVWTFPWEDKEQGKTTYFRNVNVFTDPNTIEYRIEFSPDGKQWTLMQKGLEKKQPQAKKTLSP